MAKEMDALPESWRAKVKRIIHSRLSHVDGYVSFDGPRVRVRLKKTDDPKILASSAKVPRFLPPNISSPHDAQRHIDARADIVKEAEKILESEPAEEAARLLVQACLKANKGIVAVNCHEPEDRVGLALAAIAEEIAFIAEEVITHRKVPSRQLRKVEAVRVAEAIRLIRDEAPWVLLQDPERVQFAINYFDPPDDYRFRSMIPHGKPGRPSLSIQIIVYRLTKANARLCGRKVLRATGALLAASSSEDAWWRNSPESWEEKIRDIYRAKDSITK